MLRTLLNPLRTRFDLSPMSPMMSLHYTALNVQDFGRQLSRRWELRQVRHGGMCALQDEPRGNLKAVNDM